VTNIYCLKEPVTGETFYVGQTKLHIEVRLHQHVTSASKGGGKKCARIRDIISRGHKPIVHLIEQCPPEDANERERHWIRYYSRMIPGMTNNAPAGVYEYKSKKLSGRVSPCLGEGHDKLLRLITKQSRRNMTEELRDMIEERAKTLGLTLVVG
jgi:hypothetical protein